MTGETVIGVDGCAAGWVVVALVGETCGARVHATFDEVVDAWPTAAVIAVDIPVGLVKRGWRAADTAARKHLVAHGRSSCLFAVPPRPVMRAETHEEACRLARRHCDSGISIQSFRLFPKILEVDRHARDRRIVEVHPEISFVAMARGRVSLGKKKTWSGVATRRRLLEDEGICLPARFDGDDRCGVDDVLDGAPEAWSARRWLHGEAITFPAEISDVERDRVIRIVA